MRKRSKAVFPVLSITLIVVGGLYLYRNVNGGLGGEHATSQSCDDARDRVALGPNATGGADQAKMPELVLGECERKGK